MKNIKSVFDAPNKWYVGLHGGYPIYENDISDYLMRVPPNIAIVTFVNTGLFGWSTGEDENKLRKFLFNKKHLKTYGFYYSKKDIFIDSIETETILESDLKLKVTPENFNQIRKKKPCFF